MKQRAPLLALALIVVTCGAGFAYYQLESSGKTMTAAAQSYLASLTPEQRDKSLLPYDSEQRVGWHFIPKPERKGLQIREMNEAQRQAAHKLLAAALSETGYDKAKRVIALEVILKELEKNKQGAPLRDEERYYFTIFGEPAAEGLWGLSVEGHHMSLNFVVKNERVISSTPAMYGANPATVMTEVPGGAKKGERILAQEETLAFDLLRTLSRIDRQQAIIAEKAPAEIRGAGEPQPPLEEAAGIAAASLSAEQAKLLRSLIETYAHNMPAQVAKDRLAAIDEAGFDQVKFAWAGAADPGIGHYYRIQGPTFLIEFVNTQPDAEGNVANHIHSVWRDMRGDFALPAK